MARKNLLTTKGIEMRVNRSSQVEGVFGIVKQDMQYDRFRRRGLDKVHVEMCLTLIGHLLRVVDAKTFKKKIRKKDINELLRIEHQKKKKIS